MTEKWRKKFWTVYEQDFVASSENTTVNFTQFYVLLLFYGKTDGLLFITQYKLGNRINAGIVVPLLAFFLFKKFLFVAWSFNWSENSQELFQEPNYINRGREQYHSHTQMLYTLYCLTYQKLCFLLVLPFIMSTSVPNNMPTENSHQTPFNPETLDYCLVGRLLTNKPIRFTVFKTRMATLWKPKHKVDISLMDPNRFMFQFFNYGDMEQIVQQGHWLFDNFPLVWSKIAVGKDPYTMPLDTIELWVQVHNLPFGFMTESMGILLGNHVGNLVKYDHQNNYGNWRRYMRLRVSLPVREPLKKCFDFVLEDGTGIRVNFQYEKPGNFCYVCGLIGHTEVSCEKRFKRGFVEGNQQWGPYLRADYNGLEREDNDNPWLHDGRRRGIQGGRNGTRADEGHNFHRVYGRVKIGRHTDTKELVFYKHIGALYDSDEWIRVNVESIGHIPDVAQPVGARQVMIGNLQLTSSVTQEVPLLEGDEERIARLVQEARLKNPVMIETTTYTSANLNGQPPASQLAASLAQILHMGMPYAVDPHVNSNGVISIQKPDGPKQLKRLRSDASETSVEERQNGAEAAEIIRTDSNNVIESVDVVMNESAPAANDNVMAGPGHQARQEK